MCLIGKKKAKLKERKKFHQNRTINKKVMQFLNFVGLRKFSSAQKHVKIQTLRAYKS